jgi:hypothetical protein
VDFLPNPRSYIFITEEFIGGDASNTPYGELNWTRAGTISRPTAVAGRPGLINISTTGIGAARLGDAVGEMASMATQTWTIHWGVRINTQTTDSVRCGLIDSTANDPPQGFYFEFDTAVDTNIYGVDDNGTRTKTASFQAIDANWHDLAVSNNGSNTISFSLDGGTAKTLTTNISTAGMTIACQNIARAGTVTMDLDYMTFRMAVTR